MSIVVKSFVESTARGYCFDCHTHSPSSFEVPTQAIQWVKKHCVTNPTHTVQYSIDSTYDYTCSEVTNTHDIETIVEQQP